MTIVKVDTNTNLTTMSDMCGESSGTQRELRFVLLVKKKNETEKTKTKKKAKHISLHLFGNAAGVCFS